MRFSKIAAFAVWSILFVLLGVSDLAAQNSQSANSLWERPTLTGQWQGYRGEFKSSGVDIQSHVIADIMGNVRGGVSQKTSLVENWELGLSLNLDQLIGWSGGSFQFSALQNNGSSPSSYIGDVQTANNIEAMQTIRLYELWIEQNLLENKLSLLAGVYDLNSEFDFMESSTLFLNSSQGLGGALAASGLNGISTFPATALSARVKYLPAPSWYIQAAVSDGVPGIRHVDWQLDEQSGMFGVGEVGFLISAADGSQSQDPLSDRFHIKRHTAADYMLKASVGFWMYNRNFVQRRYGVAAGGSRNETGAYLLVDSQTLSWIDKSLRNLSWHGRFGIADNQLSRFRYYFGTGFTYQNIITGISNDEMGISVSMVKNSAVFKRQLSMQNAQPEIAFEWTYQANVTPWLVVQPDLQYILNPGATNVLPDALVVGLRSVFTL